jgi:hypothetical protein
MRIVDYLTPKGSRKTIARRKYSRPTYRMPHDRCGSEQCSHLEANSKNPARTGLGGQGDPHRAFAVNRGAVGKHAPSVSSF